MSDIIVESVEYLPETGKFAELKERGPFTYVSIGPRASDGWTCLTLRSPGASRNFNITVGYLYAIHVHGQRHVLEVPDERWKLRAEEVRHRIEGRREAWAEPYFDPSSPSYYKAEEGYRSPFDPEYEAERRVRLERPKAGSRAARSAEPAPVGCVLMLGFLFLPVLAGVAMWLA